MRRIMSVVYGTPELSKEPVKSTSPGRLARSHPLELPTGAADPHDDSMRKVPVSQSECVQHLLRYCTGHTVEGLRGHRFVWALVNSMLVSEASQKNYAVYRSVLRRLGGRVGFRATGGEVLRKSQLREMIETEHTMRTVVNQLMTVGRDVRSTPMYFAYEGKKLTASVQYLAWRPPWVASAGGESGENQSKQKVDLPEGGGGCDGGTGGESCENDAEEKKRREARTKARLDKFWLGYGVPELSLCERESGVITCIED